MLSKAIFHMSLAPIARLYAFIRGASSSRTHSRNRSSPARPPGDSSLKIHRTTSLGRTSRNLLDSAVTYFPSGVSGSITTEIRDAIE